MDLLDLSIFHFQKVDLTVQNDSDFFFEKLLNVSRANKYWKKRQK